MARKKYDWVYEHKEGDQLLNNRLINRRHEGSYHYSGSHGRSTCKIDCPYCGSTVTCFIWSLSGGGKACYCGAVLGSSRSAFVEVERFRYKIDLEQFKKESNEQVR